MSSIKVKKSTVLSKIGLGSTKRSQSNGDVSTPQKWIHNAKEIVEGTVMYQAKYLGTTEVQKAKGTEVVKEAIKKLKVQWQLRRAEAGNKGSKLQRVEINISIDSLKVIDAKSHQMICGRPLHRVSYCADDHSEKKLFAFIAKDQETKKHFCFVFICDRMAADLTMTLGQAFQMAYRRYRENEKADIKRNKEMIDIGNEIEKLKTNNVQIRDKLAEHTANSTSTEEGLNGGTTGDLLSGDSGANQESSTDPSSSSMFFFHDGETPPTTPRSNGVSSSGDDINSLANPFSPSMSSPRPGSADNLFDASFETSFPGGDPQQTATSSHDLFDPFSGNATTTYISGSNSGSLDFLNTAGNTNTGNTTDFFGNTTNTNTTNFFDPQQQQPSFNSQQHQMNGFSTNQNQQQQLPYEYHDFDTFGDSPTSADFGPKVDPFADTPDWESVASVASEEINTNGAGSNSALQQNPFSIGSEQMTTNQNMDLFGTKHKSMVDPFMNSDPFATTTTAASPTANQSQNDFFGSSSADQNANMFGSTNQSSDPFGSAANQSSDPFGSINHNSDVFGSSNQMTVTDDTFGSATNQNLDIFGPTTTSTYPNEDLFSHASSIDLFGTTTPTNQQPDLSSTSNPFFSNQEQQSPRDAGNDMFADYLSKVASKDIGGPSNPFGSNAAVVTNGSGSSDFGLNDNFSDLALDSDDHAKSVTPRPRPSGLCGPGQSLRAPPTKMDVRSTNSPTTPVAPTTTSSHNINAPTSPPTAFNVPRRAQTVTTSSASKGMLPNVNRGNTQPPTLDAGISRSRARSTQHKQRPGPLFNPDAIKNASKNLEDLVGGLDEPNSVDSTAFPQVKSTITPPQTPPDQDFFKEAHSPSPKQTFQNPLRVTYASFDEL